MYFEKLYYIHLLWIVIALALFLFYRARKRRSKLEQFASREMLDKLLTRSESGRLIKIFLFLLGLTFLVLALMEPKWGYTWVPTALTARLPSTSGADKIPGVR